MVLSGMSWLDDSDQLKVEKKRMLVECLSKATLVYVGTTAQRDMSVLPIDEPLTKARLISLMQAFLATRQVRLEIMDSGAEAMVFKFIELEATDGSLIQFYVKAQFSSRPPDSLFIFSAHPDRKW